MSTKDDTSDSDGQSRSTPDPLDIFSDPAKLALGSGYATSTKQELLRLAVGKPNKDRFFRVNPDPTLRHQALLLEHGESREMYVVVPALHQELASMAQPYVLYFYITRDGTPGIWPVRLPGIDGRSNPWWETAHSAAEHAMTHWIRLESDSMARCYKIYRLAREGIIPEPTWPPLSLSDILRLGFQGRVIDSVQHLIIRQLRGDA